MTTETTAQLTRFELKRSDKRQFTGLASTWDLDDGGDLIVPGAYKRTLAEAQTLGRTIPLINQHNYFDARNAVGKMIAAEETKEGLEATFTVVNSVEGDEFLARIKDGIIDGLSIGYETRGWREPVEEEKNRGVRRVLTDIELREVSLVIWGMNPNALIDTASVKAMDRVLAAALKVRPTLAEEEKRELRQVASKIGALLRPAGSPPAEKAADATVDDDAAPPQAPPVNTADAPKAYEFAEALQQRLTRLRVARSLSYVRHRHGGTY